MYVTSAAACRLYSLLTPGGTVIVGSIWGAVKYYVGDATFPALCTSADMVMSAFKGKLIQPDPTSCKGVIIL